MNEENTGWLGDGIANRPDVTVVTVEAISKRGKQLVKRFGNRWWVCRIDDNLPCFDGGMGVLIAPEGVPWHDPSSRWVRATDWLKWTSRDLRVSEASLLEHAKMPSFVPAGT